MATTQTLPPAPAHSAAVLSARPGASEPVTVYLTAGSAAHRTGAAYIWDANEAGRLREEYRIIGDLVGTLPKHTAQNQYLSVPLVLSYVELHFGLQRGFLRMVRDDRSDYCVPNATDVNAFYAYRTHAEEVHADTSLAHQAKQREKRQTRKRARPENDDQQYPPSKIPRVATEDDTSILARFARVIRSTAHRLFPRLVHAPPPPPDDAALEAAAARERALAAEVAENEARSAAENSRRRQQAKMSTLVVTPTVGMDRVANARQAFKVCPKGISEARLNAQLLVFSDLYDKGYAMSCGAKFGADFLAYAGDPLLVHASLAVIVMDEHEPISMLDVVALGRLGDSTKKRTVLAFVHHKPKQAHEVRYVGVQWEETLP